MEDRDRAAGRGEHRELRLDIGAYTGVGAGSGDGVPARVEEVDAREMAAAE